MPRGKKKKSWQIAQTDDWLCKLESRMVFKLREVFIYLLGFCFVLV
jgi:hypothetical protein